MGCVSSVKLDGKAAKLNREEQGRVVGKQKEEGRRQCAVVEGAQMDLGVPFKSQDCPLSRVPLNTV